MAYQPKSSRKFITGVASAALVASAVAPVASSAATQSPIVKVYQANNIVAYKGQSTKDLKINPTVKGKVKVKYKNGKTAWVAVKWENVTFKKAGSQTIYGTIAGTKLKAKVKVTVKVDSVAYVNKQQNASIDEGSTKEDLLKVLPAKVKVRLASGKTQLNDASYDTSKVDFTKPGDYKVTVHAAHSDAKLDRQITVTVKAVNVSVTGVSAVNQSELTVTGAGLGKLQASDISVESNSVASVTAAADGKTATVKLNGTIAPNKDTKVSVKVGSETKDFTVNFKFDPKSVAVTAGTYDDDTANQFVKITVDGVATPVDYLKTAGYTVEFNAYNAKTGFKDNSIFKDASTGELNANLVDKAGEYNIQVVVYKGSTILTSEQGSILITNLDNASTTAKRYTLTVDTNNGTVIDSGVLVVGETANFSDVFVTDNQNTVGIADDAFTVKSSDNSVISVQSNGRTIKATGLGTAVVTIVYGNVKQEVTLTVKGEQRKLVRVDVANKTAIVGGGSTLPVGLVDQYGDEFDGTASVVVSYPAIAGLPTADQTVPVNKGDGGFTVNLPVTVGGQSGTIVFRDTDKNILGQSTIKTTAVNNQASKALYYQKTSIAGYSSDDAIDANNALDNKISYGVRYLTSEGLVNGNVTDLSGYKVKFDNKVIAVNNNSSSDSITLGNVDAIEVTPIKAGSTQISIYDANDRLVGTKTVTVTKGQPAFASVSWTAPAEVNYKGNFGYKQALKIVDSNGDNIVEGLTLTSTPVNKVRINNTGLLYVDTDGNAKYDATTSDVAIGYLTSSVVSNDGSIAASNVITGYTLNDGSNGIITFGIESVDHKVTYATKAVKVNVPKNDGQLAQAAADAFEADADVVAALKYTSVDATNVAKADAVVAKFNALSSAAQGKLKSSTTTGITTLKGYIAAYKATITPATVAEIKVLTDAIADANTLHSGATEGTASGQYAVDSKAIYKSAIDAADAVAKKAGVTSAEVTKAKSDLDKATSTFVAGKVK